MKMNTWACSNAYDQPHVRGPCVGRAWAVRGPCDLKIRRVFSENLRVCSDLFNPVLRDLLRRPYRRLPAIPPISRQFVGGSAVYGMVVGVAHKTGHGAITDFMVDYGEDRYRLHTISIRTSQIKSTGDCGQLSAVPPRSWAAY